MITDKTVELIVKYNNFSQPDFHIHKFKNGFGEEYTSLDLWHEQGLSYASEWFFLEKKLWLSEDEASHVEAVLLNKSSQKSYDRVSSFIKFVINNPFHWGHSDACIHDIGRQYLVEKKNIEEFSPNERSLITDWFDSEDGKINFYKQHHEELKFKSILPIYVQSLRNLL